MRPVVLVVAKAPVPGLAKTRLSPRVSPHQAAALAAAALLDTLDATLALTEADTVVALTGELAEAVAGRAIAGRLRDCTVIPQRGRNFATRLVNAHADAAIAGSPVVQIGMDTPQVTPELLRSALGALDTSSAAALGPAADGGWWALAVSDPQHVTGLTSVPMSTGHTGQDTLDVLRRRGLTVTLLPELIDVDTCVEAAAVAQSLPDSRFGQLAGALLGLPAATVTVAGSGAA